MASEFQLGRRSAHWRWLTIIGVIVALFSFNISGLGLSTAVAYQDDAGDSGDGDGGGDSGDEAESTDEGGADEGGDEEGGDEEGDDEAGGDGKSRSFLEWLIEASGIFGLVLLLLSFVMVALIMMNILQVRRDNMLPPAFIEQFEQKLTEKDYQGAYETARNDDSLVARVLGAGLSKLNRGYNEAIEGMQEVGEDENMAMEHRLSYLALIGSVAPMIGLMGTVYGMIESFEVIAQSATSPKPSELADGISKALFTTLEGLTVAIPAMVFYSILRNRVSRFVLEVGMVSEGLMNRFSTVGKQRPAGGAPPATAPAQPKQ